MIRRRGGVRLGGILLVELSRPASGGAVLLGRIGSAAFASELSLQMAARTQLFFQ